MARTPRIKSVSIQDFRGFPGQHNPTIELGGKNLLVYGENGAGKSTIFKALDQFFSISERSKAARAKLLVDAGHIFTEEARRTPSVEIAFTDNVTHRWDATRHPIDPMPNARVFAASYRKGMLDYRSLLDLSYRYLGKRLDLFDACESVLLRDLQISHEGSEKAFHILWRETIDLFKQTHIQSRKDSIDRRLANITAGLKLALPTLIAQTDTLLADMLHGELKLEDIEFTDLVARWGGSRSRRRITGQSLLPDITLRGEPLASPQTFLNEARVSALAIALYLAGRKVCGETLQPDTPKLLVLDDLLIGLDQSNRLPVLKMLTRHFRKWQIVLLTHDRVWFEMSRANLPATGHRAWHALEIFEGIGPGGYRHPVQRPLPSFDVIGGNLARARAFLADHYDNAGAVHTRMAFEQALKRFCERKGVPVTFKANPKDLNTGHLLDAIKSWLGAPARTTQLNTLSPFIHGVEAARRVILNPFAHSTPVTLSNAEIQAGIDAVENFHNELERAFPK